MNTEFLFLKLKTINKHNQSQVIKAAIVVFVFFFSKKSSMPERVQQLQKLTVLGSTRDRLSPASKPPCCSEAAVLELTNSDLPSSPQDLVPSPTELRAKRLHPQRPTGRVSGSPAALRVKAEDPCSTPTTAAVTEAATNGCEPSQRYSRLPFLYTKCLLKSRS